MLQAIHRYFRKDPWVRQLFQSAGIGESEIDRIVHEIYDNLFIDAATWNLSIMERDMGIIPSGSYDDRRSVIEAKLKTSDTLTLETLQNIAEAWGGGNIDVAFTNGQIVITFVNEKGIPTALDDFKNAIFYSKPAHLDVVYIVNYLTWAMAKQKYTWNQAHAFTWDDFKNQV